MDIGWWDWVIVGCVVNFIYYFFNLDYISKDNNLKKMKEAEVVMGKSEQLTQIIKELESYKRNVGLVGLCFDIIAFPFVVFGICILCIDKITDKNNNKSG